LTPLGLEQCSKFEEWQQMKSRISGKALEGTAAHRTRRKKVTPSGGKSEFRFRRLFDTAKDGILILDGRTGRILEGNPCVLELLGHSREEIIGKDLSDLGLLNNEEKIFSTLREGATVRFEQSWEPSWGGAPRELEFVCNHYDEEGRSLVQCNIRDIAEAKEGEGNLREALRELAVAKEELESRVRERTADLLQRNAELESFSYSLSHDLRAPIRAIVSFSQMALEDFGDRVGPPATGYLQKAISAAQRLDRLILDVLAFSKATRQPLAPEMVDVEQLLRAILEERPEWSPPHAEITIETPLFQILGDRASLTQCLTNLLDNALKFVPPGVVPRVCVQTQRMGSRVRLQVTDNGIGIPLAAQPRVFELFQRAHNGYEGYGIGLDIVRRAANRMHGTVGLSSEPGKGSSFWIELPAEPDT
jgi:PAS domain S-box-containing protein